MKKRLCSLALFFFLMAAGCWWEEFVPPANAAISNVPITFQEKIHEGYEYAGSASPLTNFELWHHSGGYWSNETLKLKIDDKDISRLANGLIESDQLNTNVTLPANYPVKVTEYLNRCQTQPEMTFENCLGTLRFNFRSGTILHPDEIFGNPAYTLTNDKMEVRLKLRLYVSDTPFDRIKDVSFNIWKPLTENHGKSAFAIYSRNGASLGSAYSTGGVMQSFYYPVEQGDILNAQGHLKAGKLFSVFKNSQETVYDGSQIQVGYNTFQSGGAVGMNFSYILTVDFYIPNPMPLDTIRVHYVDDQGAELLPSEKITPTEPGNYTVSAKTISGYELISPASVTVNIQHTDTEHQVTFTYKLPEPGGPVADFAWSPTSPKAKDPVQFTDLSYHPDGVPIVDWKWYVQITQNISSARHPSYTFQNEGTYHVMLVVTDANGKSDAKIKYITVEPADPKYPPVACIQAPSYMTAGDMASISSCSTDLDGEIVELWWSWTGQGTAAAPGDLEPHATSGYVFFMQPGRQVVSLMVRDNDGLTAYDEKYIEVQTPIPYAHINVGGTLKENRKVTLDASQSMGTLLYPINPNMTTWEITPLDGQSESSIKFKGNTNVGHQKDVLFKQPGRYHVLLTVYNTYGTSGQAEQIITIAEDKPPVAQYTVPQRVFRDPNNGNKATITLKDSSYSPDGDTIQQRIWMYKYDDKNDGSLSGGWITIDSGNKTEVTIEVSEVGHYYFILQVTEGFGQDTIPEFINPIDYKIATLRSGD